MGKASQTKGYRGESMWVHFIEALGLTATRVKRKQGGSGGGAADVVSHAAILGLNPNNPQIPAVHWEVKNTATLPPKGVRNALMQSRDAAKGGPCALAMHIPGTSQWGIYFETADFCPEDFGLQPSRTSSK